MRRDLPWLLVLLLLGALPLVPLLGVRGTMLADPYGEWPVKLWVFETFAEVGLLGGEVDGIGFPRGGLLNNPDPVGTAVTAVLRPLVGRAWAYNLLVVLQLQATMLATWALVRALVADRGAALLAAVAFAFTPMVLVYCVSGAITDMLNLWPYPLAVRALLAALAGGRARDGALAGALLALGFVTCPYNFVVYGVLAVPALPFLPALARGLGEAPAPPAPLRSRALAVGALVAALTVGAGAYAAWTWTITHAERSQIPQAEIDVTRHRPPYPSLLPGHRDRYTAYLADYVAVGKPALIQREAGSRYFRAFSPGLTLIFLAIVGVVAAPRRVGPAFFAAGAVWAAVVSTGPFLPVTRVDHLEGPGNLAWLLATRLPGGALILEPFRYAIPAAMMLAVAAAWGVAAFARRFGGGVGVVATALWLAELVWVSPVPVPLPTVAPAVPAVYARLDEWVGPGAVLELPFFDDATDRFLRVHFLHQRTHRRPIPDEVLGTPGRYFTENQFVASLVEAEKPRGRLSVDVTDPTRVEADRQRLLDDGFAAVIVTPGAFRTEAARDRVLERLAGFGAPVRVDDRLIYRLVPRE